MKHAASGIVIAMIASVLLTYVLRLNLLAYSVLACVVAVICAPLVIRFVANHRIALVLLFALAVYAAGPLYSLIMAPAELRPLLRNAHFSIVIYLDLVQLIFAVPVFALLWLIGLGWRRTWRKPTFPDARHTLNFEGETLVIRDIGPGSSLGDMQGYENVELIDDFGNRSWKVSGMEKMNGWQGDTEQFVRAERMRNFVYLTTNRGMTHRVNMYNGTLRRDGENDDLKWW